MARPTTFKFGAGYIEAGDGATPEVFEKICGFTKIDIDFNKDTNDTTVPDCDDPDAPAWTERDVTALSASFSCSGVAAGTALPVFDRLYGDTESATIRIRIVGGGVGGATPDRLVSGKWHTKYKLGGQRGDKWQVDFTGESDGEVTNTSVAAV